MFNHRFADDWHSDFYLRIFIFADFFHVASLNSLPRSRTIFIYIGLQPRVTGDGYTQRETEGSETCKTGFPFVRVMYISKITDSLLAPRREISSQAMAREFVRYSRLNHHDFTSTCSSRPCVSIIVSLSSAVSAENSLNHDRMSAGLSYDLV